jgi:hypothetical protein
VFAAKTAEFCKALSAILGVKVAFHDNGGCGPRRSTPSAPRLSFSPRRGTLLHQENPVFSFCTFPYFFLLFCRKVEKEIPSTLIPSTF